MPKNIQSLIRMNMELFVKDLCLWTYSYTKIRRDRINIQVSLVRSRFGEEEAKGILYFVDMIMKKQKKCIF